MRVYITGVGGFLGKALASELQASGVRRGDQPSSAALAGIDAIIHAAHDFGASEKENLALTKSWFRTAQEAGVGHQLFLSSCSAGPESAYGRVKLALEPLFLDAGQTVVRPGLVIGKGGLYARQRRSILRSPVIPTIGGGTQPVAMIELDDLLVALRRILERDLRGAYTLYRAPMPTYREFVTGIKPYARFLNIPMGLALAVTGAFERLHLPFPITPGQIRVLAAGPRYESNLAELLSVE